MDDRRADRFELLAEIADVGLDHVAASAEVVVPHVVEDLGLGQHVARGEEEETKQVELGGREGDGLTGPSHFVGALVHLDVGKAEDALVFGFAADAAEDGGAPETRASSAASAANPK